MSFFRAGALLALMVVGCGEANDLAFTGGSAAPAGGGESGALSTDTGGTQTSSGGTSIGTGGSTGGAPATWGSVDSGAPAASGGLSAIGGAPVTGGASGTGGANATGGTSSTGGVQDSGIAPDPLAPFPSQDCPGFTGYWVPNGGCLWIHGRFEVRSPGVCEVTCPSGCVRTCSTVTGHDADGTTIFVRAETGRAYAADRLDLIGIECAKQCSQP